MEEKYANIIVDISHEKVDRFFQYIIPKDLVPVIQVGMEVEIPFGRGNFIRSGYVIEITDDATFEKDNLKKLIGIKKNRVSLERERILLAAFLKEQYGSTMIAALKTVLPVKQKMKALEKKTVFLQVGEEIAKEKLEFFYRKHQVARARLLEQLLMNKSLPKEFVNKKLNISNQTISDMESMNLIRVYNEQEYRNPVFMKRTQESFVKLSDEQEYIIQTVLSDFERKKNSTYLIHGITGSGKTQVYMELIDGVIKAHKQAIMLIPEIALTYQTLTRFYNRFGDRVSVMNSKLSQGEKYDQFERAKKGEIDIVIGPRSALFTPFSNLGMIIIDEEHEGSYKSETAPRYHAREVAIQLASMKGASVVLGSATPSLEAYNKAKKGDYQLFELTRRLTGGCIPKVYVVDLREELKQGNRSIFSRKLQELILDRLQKKQQIILFLNRRGYAGFVSCRSCGHVMKCPHCDISLSEHKNGKLICHYCGYEEQMVSKCPTCGSPYIAGFKAGTQQIVESLHRIYQNIRVLRMDADTTKNKDSYEKILSAFENHEADILVGTQMIVKGHDFPNVTLVGVLAADLSLHANDYRAGERTFQLLTQAVGRAGRGKIKGEAVIQTYQPHHISVVTAAKQDYKKFYEEEMIYRQLLKYPPAAHMLVLLVSSKEEQKGLELLEKIVSYMKEKFENKNITLIGPTVASLLKIKDIYRSVLYVKSECYDDLIQWKNHVENYLDTFILINESVQFDFDPMNSY